MRGTRGVTLIELIITVAIFAVIMTAAAAVFYTTLTRLVLTSRNLDDQYYTRMALLSIVREIRHGGDVSVTAQGAIEITRNGYNVLFTLDNGILRRTGSYPTALPFAEVPLERFEPAFDPERPTLLNLTVAGNNRMTLTTQISTLRVPPLPLPPPPD